MIYDEQILKILSDVGYLGISVQILTKHVYNMNCNLFSTSDINEIHRYVQQYLLRNSKSQQSLIECTGRRGYYRLNTEHSSIARQLMLNFKEEQAELKEPDKPQEDFSLDLFA